MTSSLSSLIPFFKNIPNQLEDEFNKNALLQKIPKGQFIAMEGENCNYLPIVKSGTVRVYKLSPNGQEMTLYRINSGETCILTMSCLLSSKEFPAIAFTETDSEIYLLDARLVKEWMDKYSIWRDYVVDYMSNIVLRVLTILENTTFNRTEIRIIDFLVTKSLIQGNKLKYTHQQIASEIGTSREVVSRILKDLESERIIKLSRGIISIQNFPLLKKKNLVVH